MAFAGNMQSFYQVFPQKYQQNPHKNHRFVVLVGIFDRDFTLYNLPAGRIALGGFDALPGFPQFRQIGR